MPGYPVSGILVLEELLKPLILKWYNHGGYREENVSAVLSRPVVSGLKYREFVRVRLGKVGDKLVASPLNRGSGVVTSFVKADGILDIPQGKEGCEAGETVTVRLLRRKSDIEHTLVVTGSHDPLLDELGDMLHASDSSLYMSSSHVGSMGGIMAVRRREAHMAGIHLLNESDGTYNRSAVNKYFPQGGVRLVECVGRTQGLMVQGNTEHRRPYCSRRTLCEPPERLRHAHPDRPSLQKRGHRYGKDIRLRQGGAYPYICGGANSHGHCGRRYGHIFRRKAVWARLYTRMHGAIRSVDTGLRMGYHHGAKAHRDTFGTGVYPKDRKNGRLYHRQAGQSQKHKMTPDMDHIGAERKAMRQLK